MLQQLGVSEMNFRYVRVVGSLFHAPYVLGA